MSKDKLQWITIASEQAILMSVSLQAVVDELLLKKTGMTRKQVCSYCTLHVVHKKEYSIVIRYSKVHWFLNIYLSLVKSEFL
jgi:sorting nexin-17